MPDGRPWSVSDIPPGLIMVSGPCRCGLSVESGRGSGGATYYICCVPLKSPRTGLVVGYGAECRLFQDPNSEPPADPRVALDEAHALLAEIEPAPVGMTTALYERFDEDEVFLYVGVSDVPARRARIHLHRSTWFAFAAYGSVAWFRSRSEAESAERDAIRSRRPLFNRLHAQPGVKEELVRYLIDKGRLDLLDVSAKWG